MSRLLLLLKRGLPVLLAGLAAGTVWAAEASMQLQLRKDATITERFVTVGDVVEADAGKNLSPVLKALHIGPAPRVGNVDQLTREEVEQVMRRRMPDVKLNVEWSGPRMVKIRAAAHAVDTAALVEAARNQLLNDLRKKFEKAEVSALAMPNELELPIGEISYKPRGIDIKQSHARIPVWVDVYVNGAFYKSVVVPFSASVQQPLYVARGDSVKLILAEGGVLIEARAVAQEEGAIGQRVKVKPENGAGAVSARVVALGVVRADER